MAITRYVVAHPRLAERDFESMVGYITEELPNFMDRDISTASAVASIAPRATPNTTEATAPVTKDELAYCFAQLLGQMSAMTVRMPRRQTTGRGTPNSGGRGGGAQTQQGTGRPTGQPQRNTTQYCFMHGTNRSHNGQQCRVMALPSGFTDNQRNATAPAWIDGRQGAI